MGFEGALLPRIRVLQNSVLTCHELDDTVPGQGHQWLWADPRIERVHRVDAQSTCPSATDWTSGLVDLQTGKIGALLWIREDVHVHDFLLADRVLDLGLGHWTVRDAQGQVAMQIATTMPAAASEHNGRTLPIALSCWAKKQHVVLTTPQAHPPLLLVTATRVVAEHFYRDTALGRSVQALRKAGLLVRVMARCDNRKPLAEVYNSVICPEFADHTVVFAHDDITLHDWHLGSHLRRALEQYDIVGLAGNRACLPRQPGWPFPEKVGKWAPASQLLGCIGHDTRMNPSAKRKVHMLSRYGAPRGPASLLDGVFLGARVETLLRSGVRFDPQLAFHFYDLDFCRSAMQRGLQPGVWPLAVTHYSGGAFRSASWRTAYDSYCRKWNGQ